jgi:hypothetical protein
VKYSIRFNLGEAYRARVNLGEDARVHGEKMFKKSIDTI